jgi:hypothetical protein
MSPAWVVANATRDFTAIGIIHDDGPDGLGSVIDSNVERHPS